MLKGLEKFENVIFITFKYLIWKPMAATTLLIWLYGGVKEYVINYN